MPFYEAASKVITMDDLIVQMSALSISDEIDDLIVQMKCLTINEDVIEYNTTRYVDGVR